MRRRRARGGAAAVAGAVVALALSACAVPHLDASAVRHHVTETLPAIAGGTVTEATEPTGPTAPAAPTTGDPGGAAPREAASEEGVSLRQVAASTRVVAPVLGSAHMPDDPLIEPQAAYLDAIRASAAWDRGADGAGVVVAVVDTGVDATHPELAGRIWQPPEAVIADALADGASACDATGCAFMALETADASCGYDGASAEVLLADDNGHGTFVAGVVAAAADNSQGISGIASGVRILPVKVLDCEARGRASAAAAGIRYAAQAGADVIVTAFGGSSDSDPLREAVEEAIEEGALIVAAAGNDAGARAQYPAAYRDVLSVAGSGHFRDDQSVDYERISPFSNPRATVDLVAPAVGLIGPVPDGACDAHRWSCMEGGYARASGTSFAAPLVAGAAALLYGLDGDLAPDEVTMLLTASAMPAAGLPAGHLDIATALALSGVEGESTAARALTTVVSR
ncbi:MAG: S8 family serine peptidase [Dehalococcoidia bacterium]